MLRKINDYYRQYSSFDYQITMVWNVGVILGSLVLLFLAIANGQFDRILPLLALAIAAFVMIHLTRWLVRYNPKPEEGAKTDRRECRPRPDGDMSDVVGVGMPPWMC